jgi:alpha-beta hydrolase superfamily lysophospholipase
MFVSARQVAEAERLGRLRHDLPVYVAVGDQDPVNGRLALVHGLVQRLEQAGLTEVTLKIYEGARHEVFNETNRNEVVADLLAWLDRVLPVTS